MDRSPFVVALALSLVAAVARCSSFSSDEDATSNDASTAETSGEVDGSGPDAEIDAGSCTPTPAFDSDPRHCGRCGRDCGRGACVAGECEAYVLVDNVAAPFYIAVDDAYAYWTSFKDNGVGVGTVQRVDKLAGGAPQTIASLGNSFALAFAGGWLYATAPGEGAVGLFRMLPDGGALSTEYDAGVLEVAAGGADVYFSATNGGIWSSSADGGLSLLVADAGNPEGLVTSGVLLYWANRDQAGSIGRTTLGGLDIKPAYVPNENRPRRVAVDDTALYWTSNATGGGLRRKVKGQGNLVVTLLADAGTNRGSIVVDDRHAYATLENTGRVVRMRKDDGGELRELAVGLSQPIGIAEDATAIYFTERGKNRVWRMVK